MAIPNLTKNTSVKSARALAFSRALASKFEASKKITTASTDAVDALAIVDTPIPGVDKNDPMNAATVASLAHMKDTDQALYSKLMHWG